MSTDSIEAVIEILEATRGAKIVGMTTDTITEHKDMLKKHRDTKLPNPFPAGVMRRADRVVILGANYERVVRRNWDKAAIAAATENGLDMADETVLNAVLADVPEFNAQALWGGKGRHRSPYTVEHVETGEVYLYCMPKTDPDNHLRSVVVRDEWFCVETGRTLDHAEIKGWMRLPGNSRSGQTWRTFKTSSVRAVRCGSVTFNLVSA